MATLDDLSGRTLGEFVLGERLDEGGFGAVYRCDQPMLGRKVVVKVLHQQLRHDDAALERFKREAQLASRLDHPYAAHVYAFGTESDGLRWIAMELVQGITLDRWIDERGPMSLEQLVPFFERVAQVVQAAHRCGIVHRDLKPSNVMVIERDGTLLPKLLDFGVARLLSEEPASTAHLDLDCEDCEAGSSDIQRRDMEPTAAMHTRDRAPAPASPYRLTPANAVIGSPPYMAPEQWRSPLTVGPEADLYALGVIAYEALTGRRPFQADCEDEYRELHCAAPIPPLGKHSSPALDEIFQRALAKRPEDRFGNAREFAEALDAEMEARMLAHVRSAAKQWRDRRRPIELLWRGEILTELERWIDGSGAGVARRSELEFAEASRQHETVLAEASRRLAEASRRRRAWVRRGAVAAVVAMVLAVIGALYARAAMMQQRATANQQVADATALTAEVEQGRAASLHDDLAEAQRHLAEAYRRGDHSPATEFMLARALQPLRAELARLSASSGRMWSAAFSPDGRRIVTTDDQAAQIWDAETHQLLATLPHGETVHHAVYTRDGMRVVTACGDGIVRVWEAATGVLQRELRLSGRTPRFYVVAASPTADHVAAVDGAGAIAVVWSAGTGAVIAVLELDGSQWPSLRFSADGRWLAAGGGDQVHVVDTTHWGTALTLHGPQIRAMAWDPTSPHLATGSAAGDASIWDVPGGMRLRHLRDVGEPVDAVAWSPDGTLVAAASQDGAEQVFEATSGRLMSHGHYLNGKITSIEFDATSHLVAAGGANGTAVVVDARLGLLVTVLDGSRKVIRDVHFDPRSPRLIGASSDGTVRIWDTTSPYRRWSSPPIADGCDVATALEPDGRFLAIGCRGHATRVWDTAHDQLLAELPAATSPGVGIDPALPAISAEGDRVAIARGNTVEVYEVPGGRRMQVIEHSAAVSVVTFARTGRNIISGAVDGTLLVARDGDAAVSQPTAPRGIDAVGFAPDGRVLVADARGQLRVIDADRRVVLAELDAGARVGLLRPSPDGHTVVTIPVADAAGPPILWDLDRYQILARLDGHVGRVFAARWIAGERILTAGGDGSARMWDRRGELLQTYRGDSRLGDAVLDPSGLFVVAGSGDGRLWFWDAVSGRALWTTAAHRSAIVGLHFEGSALITHGFGGDLSRWIIDGACKACGIVAR